MQYFRLIAFLFAIAVFGMLAAFGQTPGTPTSQAPAAAQAASPTQAPTAETPQQSPSPNMQPPADPNLAPLLRRLRIHVQQQKLQMQLKPKLDRPLDPRVDQGIYLRAAGGNMCGTIVSYNFSAGDNPELKNVTTCTPSNGVRTLRTQDEDQRPQTPLLQKTTYSPGPKQ